MIGVLTGDVVASTKLPESERGLLIEKLERAIGGIGQQFREPHWPAQCVSAGDPGQPALTHQIFRGDSFQIALRNPRCCLDSALCLYLAMLVDEFGALPRVELRIGIGFGKARVGSPNELGQWSGEAFELAAKALAKLSIGSGRLALLSPIPAMNEEFEVHLALLDTVLRRWTDDQRDTLFKLLYYRHGQTQLAEQFGVTQSAISQRLRGAGWDGVQSLLDRYKELMNHKHSRQGEG